MWTRSTPKNCKVPIGNKKYWIGFYTMLGLIIYLVVTVFAGFILAFFAVTFRSTKKRGDGSPYFTIFLCLLLTTVGPFLFVEGLTKAFGQQMEPAIKKAYADG